MRGPILITVIFAAAAGCGTTSPEVLELSRATAINAGLLTTEIQRFVEDEQRFADARRNNIQQLRDTVGDARERYEVDRLYTREAEGEKFEKRERKLLEFIAKVDAVIDKARADRVEVSAPKALSVDDRVQALAALAKSLASLAKPSDLKSNLSFVKGYIETVQVHVEAAAKAAPLDTVEDQRIKTKKAVVDAASER